MTEKQWLRAAKSWDRFYERLVWMRARRLSGRKYRLWGCACCRRLGELLPDPRSQRAVALAEQYADGAAGKAELVAAKPDAWRASRERGHAAVAAAMLLDIKLGSSVSAVAVNAAIALYSAGVRSRDDEQLAQTELLLDIFGNLFRKPQFDKAWRTGTAVALARQMYESREFGAMPILADALQDAGCDHADVLNHCRDAKRVHVRGCWVVDLVLGKE